VRPMPFGPRAERRREERITVEVRAELLDEPDGEWRKAEVVNLSWHGVRVRGERLALKRGRCLDLVITQTADRDRRRARVVWVAGAGGPALDAGLEFV
jgi:hypothetical protein